MARNTHGYPEEYMTPLQGGEHLFKQPTVYGQYVEEIAEEPTAGEKCYKPFPLRGPFLCGFMFLILIYLALFEIAVRHYPRYDSQLMPTNVTRSPVTATATGKTANTPRQYDSSSFVFTFASDAGQFTSSSAIPTTRPAFLPDDSPTPLLNTPVTVSAGTSITSSGAFLPITTPVPSSTPPGAFLPDTTPPSVNMGGQPEPTNPYRGSSSSPTPNSLPPTVITGSPNPNSLLPTTPAPYGSPELNSLSSTTSPFVFLPPLDSLLPTTNPGSPSPNKLLPTSTQTTLPTDASSVGDSFFLSSITDSPDAIHFTNSDYFIGSYSMVLAGILLRVLWTMVYNNFRIMEPFYQLSMRTGARADHVFSSLYLSSSFLPDLIGSLWKNQWSIVLGSAASILIDLFISIAAEVLSVDAKHCHTQVYFDQWSALHPCVARVVVHDWPFRFAEALLSGLFVVVLLATILSWRRRSGIYAEPSNIAYMTSLLHHPEVVDLFSFSDPYCSGSELKRELSGHRYKISYYHTPSGILRYGVVPVDSHGYTSPSLDRLQVETKGGGYFRQRAVSRPRRNRPRNKTRETVKGYAGDMLILLVVIAVLGLVIGYYKTPDASSFNAFMNSGTFGPNFLFTMIGTIIVGLWKRQDRETRAKSPFYQLRTPSTAKPLLSTIYSSAWTSFPVALVSGSFFSAFVSLNAILAELLTIALSTIPFSGALYWKAWIASFWLSVAVLSLMVIAGGLLIVRRFTGPRLPRAPDTLANVWSYVAASYMRADFEELALLSTNERRRRVMGWGKTYMFKKILDVDGLARMAVDECAGE